MQVSSQARMAGRKRKIRYWSSGGTSGKSRVPARGVCGILRSIPPPVCDDRFQHPYHAIGWRLHFRPDNYATLSVEGLTTLTNQFIISSFDISVTDIERQICA